MFNPTQLMSDYLGDLASLDQYGCAPMSVADLMEEFEGFIQLQDQRFRCEVVQLRQGLR